MTVIMTLRLCDYLGRLTTIPWKKSRHHLCCSVADFRWRKKFLDFELSLDIGHVTLPKFVAHLRDSPNSRMFVNYVGDGLKWPKKLSKLLAVADVPIFVLEIHDEMDENEKFTAVRLFTDAAHLAGVTPHALVATSAGNSGIGHARSQLQST